MPTLLASWLIPLIIIAAFGVIVLAVILLKRHVKFFQSDEKPKNEKEIAEEELNRLLEPVEEMKEKGAEGDETAPEEPAKEAESAKEEGKGEGEKGE